MGFTVTTEQCSVRPTSEAQSDVRGKFNKPGVQLFSSVWPLPKQFGSRGEARRWVLKHVSSESAAGGAGY